MIFKVLTGCIFGIGFGLALIAAGILTGVSISQRDDATSYGLSDSKREEILSGARFSKNCALFCWILFAVLLVCFILVPWNFYTIDPGEAAVVKHLGVAQEIKTSGTYTNFYMTDKIEIYDTKVRTIDIETMTYSNDAQTMDITMTIQYHINSENLLEIVNQYGDISALENKLQSVSVEKTKSVLSSYKAMDIIANRSAMSPLISNTIRETITPDYYVTITTVVVTNIDFTEQFEKAVEDKMIAEQKKLQADYENQQAIAKAEAEAKAMKEKAEIEIEVARKKAEALLIEAEANKKAQAEVAKAEAVSMKYNAVEIARSLGLTVVENYDESGLLESYTVDYSSDTDGSKAKLVATYLEYVIYLETWDGALPNTLVTDGSATIMVTP